MKKPLIVKDFDEISNAARERIYALVLNHAKKHPNSPWSGKFLVELEKSIKEFYKDMGVKYQGAFRNTLPDIMKSFYDKAVEEIKTAGIYKTLKGTPDPQRIKYFLNNSFEQVAMKTDKMAFEHIRQLRSISAEVLREMSITGNTRRQVSDAMLERALKIKGFEFIDKAGSKWSNKSYFNMLARTELMNAARASYDDKMAEEGFDVMELSYSGNCCEHCAKYEGKLFSLTGAIKGIPSKSDLEADGVFHPNCTHSYSLVPPAMLPEDLVRRNSGQNIHSFKRIFRKEPEDGVRRFDGNFYSDEAKDFNERLAKLPLSNSQIDEFNFHMQKTGHLLTKKPVVIISNSGARTDPKTWVIEIDKHAYSWHGNRNTIAHEWGELLFNNLFQTEEAKRRLHLAMASDSANFDKHFLLKKSKNITDVARVNLTNQHARAIFGKDYDDLKKSEQHRIESFFDIAGSATAGIYGFGHFLTEYDLEMSKGRFGNDAFACMYSAVINNQEEFKETYPNLWNFVEDIINEKK